MGELRRLYSKNLCRVLLFDSDDKIGTSKDVLRLILFAEIGSGGEWPSIPPDAPPADGRAFDC